jgi:hypothetical protein
MTHPISPTPSANDSGCDSLTADIVIADDRGGTTVLPADPEALARYLAECRRLDRGSSAKEEPKS